MTKRVKKLFNGFASIRDYEVEKCFQIGEDLQIKYGGETMTVLNARLEKPFRLHKKKFQSKINPDQQYGFYDFVFIADGKIPVKEVLKVVEMPKEMPLL